MGQLQGIPNNDDVEDSCINKYKYELSLLPGIIHATFDQKMISHGIADVAVREID